MLLLIPFALAQDPEEPAPTEEDAVVTVVLPAEDVRTVGLADSPMGVGLGVSLGLPTGVSVAWRNTPKWLVSGALAWDLPNRAVEVHVDLDRTLVQIVDDNAPGMTFPLTVGVGPKFQSRKSVGNATPLLGVRVPLSLYVLPNDYPIDAFIELAPVLELYPGTEFTMDAALGARVFFK